ncbi:MAG: hypothetical protein V4667_04480 [Bacteroidota bacterium]
MIVNTIAKIGQLLVILISLFFGCRKNDDKESSENPKECITIKIEEIENAPKRNPPVKIWSYNYKGAKVHYITSYCCDVPSILLDENCNVICSPDGGITGNGDGKCTDFFKNRTNEKLVWEDKR